MVQRAPKAGNRKSQTCPFSTENRRPPAPGPSPSGKARSRISIPVSSPVLELTVGVTLDVSAVADPRTQHGAHDHKQRARIERCPRRRPLARVAMISQHTEEARHSNLCSNKHRCTVFQKQRNQDRGDHSDELLEPRRHCYGRERAYEQRSRQPHKRSRPEIRPSCQHRTPVARNVSPGHVVETQRDKPRNAECECHAQKKWNASSYHRHSNLLFVDQPDQAPLALALTSRPVCPP
jgi:hypothetical protein